MKKIVKYIIRLVMEKISVYKLKMGTVSKINLCCGAQQIPGYLGIDYDGKVDLILDLKSNNLPFENNSLDVAICVSAINYFTRDRGREIVEEIYRVLKPKGIARFGVQDLESISKRYVENDKDFFFQKLPNGSERFEGPTIGDKYAAWFYGYISSGTPCRYFYDYESLAYLFSEAGFSVIEKRDYRDSRIDEIDLIDNRSDQMFFLEAVK